MIGELCRESMPARTSSCGIGLAAMELAAQPDTEDDDRTDGLVW